MRTKAPMLFVAAVLVVGMAWQLAGMSAALGISESASPASGVPVDELNETAGEYNVNEGISGQAPGSDAGGLIGISIQAGKAIFNIAALAATFPVVLANSGLPSYWAYPLGLLAQIVSFIGVAQFISKRDWR